MPEEDAITDARIRRVVNQHIRPALNGPTAALAVAAYHVHGEPVTVTEALNAAYEPFPVGGAFPVLVRSFANFFAGSFSARSD